MILSDIIGLRVVDPDGDVLGRIVDARFRLEGSGTPSTARLVGIIVSPRSATSFLGYERSSMSRPVVLARILRWMHRGSCLVPWHSIAGFYDDRVELRDGYEQLSSSLDDDLS
jgi:hypothetical protein